MTASPSSAVPLSDVEPPTSPALMEKSFMTNMTEDEDARMADATPEPSSSKPRSGGRSKAAREAAAAAASMVGKIRHLKKADGEPLWRKDIQYDFLKAVFDNEHKVFTNSYEATPRKQCFADLYIDTMSRSSKTSKVLHDKLLSDRVSAKGMAMVCLLVNIGRMNTTLNFFPEMRAQLRTYHSIPSLQAYQDAHVYKQLQDAPRLKSILKGGSEDRAEPQTLEAIKGARIPRTNPVNLLFVICQSASKIAELHFKPHQEFHDLVMKTNFTSHSRAMAFLWIMWFYLESDFTEEGCEENPFGAGVDYGVDVANQGVPELKEMTAEEEALENVDPKLERDFGLAKQALRERLLEWDQQFVEQSQPKRASRGGAAGTSKTSVPDDSGTPGILPRIRPSKHESDIDSVRSTPPPRALAARQSGALSGTGGRRGGGALKNLIFEGSSPAGSHGPEGLVVRKPRPPTAHQLAVERNRSQRVNHILARGIRRQHHQSRKLRRSEGSITRALARLKEIPDPFADSDNEEFVSFNGKPPNAVGNGDQLGKEFLYRERGVGGLSLLTAEEDDFGEEVSSYAFALRRAERRLRRWKHWSEDHDEPLGVMRPIKRLRPDDNDLNSDLEGEDEALDGLNGSLSKELIDPAETEDELELYIRETKPKVRRPRAKTNGAAATNGDGDTPMDDADDLDDVEKGLLGIADEEDDEGAQNGDEEEDEHDDVEDDDGDVEAGEDAELDPMDKTLLGMDDGDSDSD